MSESKKEKALRELSDQQLLELAEPLSESSRSGRKGRSELIKIIKDHLSSQEIEEKVAGLRRSQGTGVLEWDELRLGGIGQAFLAASVALNIVGYSW